MKLAASPDNIAFWNSSLCSTLSNATRFATAWRNSTRERALSEATVANIRQNLFFAFVYNAVGVPVAAGLLYPFLGITLSPMVAAAAMSASSVSVISNALRLRAVTLN